jgi:hypothetical protein
MKMVGHPKDAGDTKQRRRTVVGLESFANRKGVGKAIAKFRERKQRKRLQTAQALRKYAKVMKEEGYEAGKGASRKRKESSRGTREEEEEHQSTTVDHGTTDTTSQTTNEGKTRKRHKKTNPYKNLAEQHEKFKAVTVVDKATQERERQQKLRQRRQRTHKLRQKTSRGQPVMRQRVALVCFNFVCRMDGHRCTHRRLICV